MLINTASTLASADTVALASADTTTTLAAAIASTTDPTALVTSLAAMR